MGKNGPPNGGYTPESLERVSGIGPRTAEALTRIGIRRLNDLAQATPETLAKGLFEQVGLRVSPERIAAMNWIGQAQMLQQQISSEQPAQDQHAVAEGTLAASAGAMDLTEKTQWPQHAGFLLFFDYQQKEERARRWRTRVYHHESGAETQFPGTTPDAWLNWILQQAQLPAEATPDSVAPVHSPISPAASVSTPSLALLEVEVSEKPQAVPSGLLMAEIRFNVIDSYGEALTSPSTPYQVLVLTIDLNGGQLRLIAAEHGALTTVHSVHRHALEFPIPELGRYELVTIALVQGDMELVAVHRGPALTVVPKPASN